MHMVAKLPKRSLNSQSSFFKRREFYPPRYQHRRADLEGAQDAMDWVTEGDLLILLSHEQLDDVMKMVLERGSTWGYSQEQLDSHYLLVVDGDG